MANVSGRSYSLSIEVSSKDGGKPYRPNALPHEYSLTFNSDDRAAWESFTAQFWESVFGSTNGKNLKDRVIVVDRSLPTVR